LIIAPPYFETVPAIVKIVAASVWMNSINLVAFANFSGPHVSVQLEKFALIYVVKM
jgi:hypothetical protein